jgi:hypothetical protein
MARDRNRKGVQKRKENTREARKSLAIRELLNFSFKYLDETQPTSAPETITDWKKEDLLCPLIERLKELSRLTRDEAVKQQQIKVYGRY